ncbi:uncharacterized protein LOC133931117 [Phragmites australis]|uniref:uncharacterized protein LOC133931117 n=1 Tax=Phragmites australis TaxID=29695 RepID=UPI002D76C518|nr:uncharacterized protein LOC133931117 [Phragmites australis]
MWMELNDKYAENENDNESFMMEKSKASYGGVKVRAQVDLVKHKNQPRRNVKNEKTKSGYLGPKANVMKKKKSEIVCYICGGLDYKANRCCDRKGKGTTTEQQKSADGGSVLMGNRVSVAVHGVGQVSLKLTSGKTLVLKDVLVFAGDGFRRLPDSFKSTTSNVPSGRSLMYFCLFLASGIFLVFIASMIFLPVMVIMPQKFAIRFTAGCAFIIGSFFALKGPKNQLYHMISKARLPFTLGFVGSMVATIYVSMVLRSYILSVFFSMLQVLTLAYYAISYFPGGSAGMKFLSSALVSSVLRCFGR